MRYQQRQVLLLVLFFLTAGCASSEENVRQEESAQTEDEAPKPPAEAPAETAPEASQAKKEPVAPKPKLDPSLVDGSYGFHLSPLSGMHHLSEAATEGIDVKTEAFLKASGIKRAKNRLYLFYRADPSLALLVEQADDESLSKELSKEAFDKAYASYRRSLGYFGMTVVSMQRMRVGNLPVLLLEYKKTRRPFLRALSAVYYGLGSGRHFTVTYTADAFSWTEELREKLILSIETFRLTRDGEDG
jgi:hypothetical protein